MYQYNEHDREFLDARVAQFRSQVERKVAGTFDEEEFRPLRLLNGLYHELHAHMLRVAIPYGTLSATQMVALAEVAQRWDRGYGHFTTRQNIQFNWPELSDIPAILDTLASVGVHSIQSSGNTVRNVTSDPLAGASADEVVDPRPYAELLRQWSSDHAEFQFLGRKFKIAMRASKTDRTALRTHDLGLVLQRNETGELEFEVWVGGGLGRTPMAARLLRAHLPETDMLPYVEAVLSVFNELGRRDNKYKARIKIAVHELGLETISGLIDERFEALRHTNGGAWVAQLRQIQKAFLEPDFRNEAVRPADNGALADTDFRAWQKHNLSPHKIPGYTIATVSLKAHGQAPGNATAAQIRGIAELAEKYSHGEIRVSHRQNLILPHVHQNDLAAVFAGLQELALATANIGHISDIIACPGLDYCSLATAHSIPLAKEIAEHFDAVGLEQEIGQFQIKISGCVNACGHHHVGHIGILGLEKAGIEHFQMTIGGDASEEFALGKRTGPGFARHEVLPALERLVDTYLRVRTSGDENFIRTFQRVGIEIFKIALYDKGERANVA